MITMYYDQDPEPSEQPRTLKRVVHVARITHRCDNCEGNILPGQKYCRWDGLVEGVFETTKYHIDPEICKASHLEVEAARDEDNEEWMKELNLEIHECNKESFISCITDLSLPEYYSRSEYYKNEDPVAYQALLDEGVFQEFGSRVLITEKGRKIWEDKLEKIRKEFDPEGKYPCNS